MDRVLREVRRVLARALLALCVLEPMMGAEASPTDALTEGLYAEIATPRGVMTARLFLEETPLAVMSFVGLAEGKLGPRKGEPFFDGLVFHRVVPGFVVQGGDPQGRGEGRPGYTFPDEFIPGLSHDAAGVLSMANTGPDTNGAQFFITLAPAVRLDYLHTVFGRLERGLEVLPQIQPGDTMRVRILRVGTAAEALAVDAEAFSRLVEGARRKRDAEKVAAAAEAKREAVYFADPDALLPAEPPRARAFDFKLAAFARVTGRKIFVRLLENAPEPAGKEKFTEYVRSLARELDPDGTGVVAVYVAERDEWKLWIGAKVLPGVMGSDGTIEAFTRSGALHARKEALLKTAKQRLAAPAEAGEPRGQRLKLACDELLAALIAALEPR